MGRRIVFHMPCMEHVYIQMKIQTWMHTSSVSKLHFHFEFLWFWVPFFISGAHNNNNNNNNKDL